MINLAYDNKECKLLILIAIDACQFFVCLASPSTLAFSGPSEGISNMYCCMLNYYNPIKLINLFDRKV